MSVRKLKSRYEIKDILGQGGMGVVYKAYDTVVKRDVAVKTLRGIPGANALKLFQKECEVLASLSHPNIVEIFDVGEFEDQGEHKPFLVMPLLPGSSLDKLIHNSGQPVSVDRAVEIITQACRGLHAAHEQGLVHRDLKPSNIFVLRDDSVKIIDFGVALMVDSRTTRGQKGTLLYMAPEQVEMKPLSALSDLFSLGVVCYETFTHRRPFERATEGEVAEAILRQFPPPASEINPAVSQGISRVVHKAMAKQPWHRFTSVREFSETLGKALRSEPIEFFDPARTQPRIQRARNAFEQADYQFAGEILSELEAEGHLDPEISDLRRRIDQAVRQKTVRQLLENARTRFEQDEYPLALQKIQEVLQLDPENATALGLKSTIESKRTERKIDDWLRLAHQHVSNHGYGHARQALQNVLQLRPSESRALQLIAEVDRREQEYLKVRQEKEEAYKAAQDSWRNGEVSAALTKMGQVLELERRNPDSSAPERTTSYQNFYNQVRSEHDAMNSTHAEARKHLADRDFAKAFELCDKFLSKYPDHALFQALKFEIEEQERQERSSFIAEIDRQVEAEHDLVQRVSILEDALKRYPGEAHFERALRLMREKRDLANSIVAKARLYEERSQFAEALSQWEILRTIYRQFPGLDFEIERVVKRRDQQARIDSKGRWVKQIEQQLQWGSFARAVELSKEAQAEFPDDSELAELERQVHQGVERASQVQGLLAEGQELCGQHRFEEGIEALRKAYQFDERNSTVRAALAGALAEQAREKIDTDWSSARGLIGQALEIDPDHGLAKSLRTLAADRERQEVIDRCLSKARQLQAAGDIEGARAEVEKGLAAYPNDPRLAQRHASLHEALEGQRSQTRRRDLEELQRLDRDVKAASDPAELSSISTRALTIAKQYPSDQEFQFLATSVGKRLESMPPAPVAAPRAGKIEAAKAQNPPGAPVPPSPPGRQRVEPPRPASAAPKASKISAPPVPAPQVAAAKPNEPPSEVKDGRSAPSWIPIVGGAGLVVILAVGLGIWWKSRQQKVEQTAPLAVEISTSPPGAQIWIDNQEKGSAPLQVKLPAGTHEVKAVMAGYQSVSKSLPLKQDSVASSLILALDSLPQVVLVSTDLDAGEVLLDGNQAGELRQGQWKADNVELGKSHSLEVKSRAGDVTLRFDSKPASLAEISDLAASGKLTALVIASQGGKARAASSSRVVLGVDGGTEQEVGSGLELSEFAAGKSHNLVLKQGKNREERTLDLGENPTLSVFLSSGRGAANQEVAAAKTPKIPPPKSAPLPPQPAGNPNAAEIGALLKMLPEAYEAGNYAEPSQKNAIYYSKRLMELDSNSPNSRWAQQYLERSVKAGEYQIQQAGIVGKNKDFRRAYRIQAAMAQLLPDRHDVADLRKDIEKAEKAEKAAQSTLPKEAAPVVSFPVKHIRQKGPGGLGGFEPLSDGTLVVVDHRLRYQGKERDNLDYACGEVQVHPLVGIRGLRKPALKVGSQAFITDDNPAEIASALNKACSK